MKYPINDSLNIRFRKIRTKHWLGGVLAVLFAVGMPSIVPATLMSTVELVSVNKDGTGSGAGSSDGQPVISADGRFVAFASTANDLVAKDTNVRSDVFVRDLQSGTTTLVSVNKDGTDSGNDFSFDPVISADGRFVAFTSHADDLAATDTNHTVDVFVRDLRSGITTLVSVNKDGICGGASGLSYNPVISADGRFVAFASDADDLVATDTNSNWDVFVRDLQSGTTTLVSVNRDGTDSGSRGSDHNQFGISADGRFVAFASPSNDLVATTADNSDWNVFVRDLQRRTTTLVSVNKDGTGAGAGSSSSPVISADGRFVGFFSDASDLVATDLVATDTSFNSGVLFVRDLQSGTTTLLGRIDSDIGLSSGPAISADGRFVALASDANDLVATDTNGDWDVFVRDLQSGTITLVSTNKDGTGSGAGHSYGPVISADGRTIAFLSDANDLVTTDNNGTTDVFVFGEFKVPQGCNCDDPGAIQGTSGQDILYGTEQADIICGLGGQDFIAGQSGDDCIDGGEGNDWIDGGDGDDRIFGMAGKDVIYGHDGNDEISGDEDEDYLFGGDGDDRLDGGEGYDWVFCGSGTDEGIGEYLRKCEN